MKQMIHTPKAPAALGPYSQAIHQNGMLFISGQVPINQDSGELYDDIEMATHQIMKNLQYILAEVQFTLSNVVKTSIFLKDMNDFAVVNEIYASYFEKGNYPARETMQVSVLPKNACLEVSMIACK